MTDTPQVAAKTVDNTMPKPGGHAVTNQARLSEVIGRFEDLPTLAPVAVEVLRLADDEDSSMKDITDAIERDPGLTVRLLRLANTAAYNRGGEVSNINRAAMLLGLRTLKLVSLGFSLVSNLTTDRIDASVLWHRSVVSGIVARRFALSLIHI